MSIRDIILSRHPFFEPAADVLAPHAKCRPCTAGQVVLQNGVKVDSVILVASGQLTFSGEKRVFGPGCIFGAMVMMITFPGAYLSAQRAIVCTQPGRILEIEYRHLCPNLHLLSSRLADELERARDVPERCWSPELQLAMAGKNQAERAALLQSIVETWQALAQQ